MIMKVKVEYTLVIEKEIEISCEDYCHAHANHNFLGKDIIPVNAENVDIKPSTKADEMTLTDYFYN